MEAWAGGVYFIYLFIYLWEFFIYLWVGVITFIYLFIGVIALFIYLWAGVVTLFTYLFFSL